MRTWRSIREVPSAEDAFVREWLVMSPPLLMEVVLWTKGCPSATGETGERVVKWMPLAQGIGWSKWEKERFEECDLI